MFNKSSIKYSFGCLHNLLEAVLLTITHSAFLCLIFCLLPSAAQHAFLADLQSRRPRVPSPSAGTGLLVTRMLLNVVHSKGKMLSSYWWLVEWNCVCGKILHKPNNPHSPVRNLLSLSDDLQLAVCWWTLWGGLWVGAACEKQTGRVSHQK